MTIKIIKSEDGKEEYALVPVQIYKHFENTIDDLVSGETKILKISDYIENPVALMRISAHIGKKVLAEKLNVTRRQIVILEAQQKVSKKNILKVKEICEIEIIERFHASIERVFKTLHKREKISTEIEN